jgi:hypothetical protein
MAAYTSIKAYSDSVFQENGHLIYDIDGGYTVEKMRIAYDEALMNSPKNGVEISIIEASAKIDAIVRAYITRLGAQGPKSLMMLRIIPEFGDFLAALTMSLVQWYNFP